MRTFEFNIQENGFKELPIVMVRLKDDDVWTYAPRVKKFPDERPVAMFSGWVSIEEAERIHAKIGEAIRIAKSVPVATTGPNPVAPEMH